MSELAHTPYEGSKKPFSIGLAPLDLTDWIEPDEHLAAHLAEKHRLFDAKRSGVFGEEAGTRDAQAEVLALLVDYLPERYPGIYSRDGDRMVIAGVDEPVDLAADEAPLAIASFLVQEDLVLMRPGPDGYRLVAGSLCFPSSWSLAEKFGKPMRDIHGPVPGWEGKMGQLVDRIFDKLKVDQPVWRLNWSIYPDADLHHPESKQLPRDWFSGDAEPEAFVRVERQTLRRLPVSGDILFTIKIHVDPFEALARHPDGARLAAGLREQILSLDEAQLAYKAMSGHRDRIIAALDKIASGKTAPAAIGAA